MFLGRQFLQICFQPKRNASLIAVLFYGAPTLSRPLDEVLKNNSYVAIDPIKNLFSGIVYFANPCLTG